MRERGVRVSVRVSVSVVTYSEGEVPWLSHTVLAWPDIVQVPEEDDEHQAGDDVTAPDIHECHVIRAVV